MGSNVRGTAGQYRLSSSTEEGEIIEQDEETDIDNVKS